MYQSLSQFYTSAPWRSLRKTLIAERTAADGLVYDEFNGKIILNENEIIIHHKVPLTLNNVNDASISLNPDNLMIVSYKSHNEVHKRFGNALREVVVVFGSPLSGKTTFVKNNKSVGDLVLDLDEIWKAVTYEEKHIYRGEVKPVVMALRQCLLEQIKMRSGKWNTAWIISTEALPMQQERLLEQVNGKPIYIETSKEECLARLYNNQDRDIKLFEKLINDYFEKQKKFSEKSLLI